MLEVEDCKNGERYTYNKNKLRMEVSPSIPPSDHALVAIVSWSICTRATDAQSAALQAIGMIMDTAANTATGIDVCMEDGEW